APHDAEAQRAYPFERLLFPFHWNPQGSQAQAPARVAAGLRVYHLNRRDRGVAIESIRVRDERPQLFRRRLKIEFPAIMEFPKRHKAEVRSQRSEVSSTKLAVRNKERIWVLHHASEHPADLLATTD